ncbi:DNA polymerase III subunit gamma/tau [Xylophilus ampelinus]|uniref:DNA polymerase III subunit gamma/tau n=1 Tax=Xylophilus ampelinus TaxID=54067 RepID=A0A318SK07_9BURK|nr:DNA polymerase III subunit gamma/tau [Xylophilus ampelinus]MCS4508774.1 DNA polymerase III subunit gamma/tau [Xylophilus ampelinus]PYE79344.1 DNA polymerase-3 subunit gamma/tau [Xylophilus ampelinus]
MSYLVLARKYRPRNFSEMVGQEHVVRALSNALRTQRLHHAYLFTGTRGVGKTTVSRILAKSLNCVGSDGQGGITSAPCGVCQACTDIDAGRFVDYTELDAASNRGVDEVQSLLEQAVYKPVVGRFKVFMIDEVHMLTNTAFNAMLKTLEEPPEYLKFVLATTDPQKVPVTVLSRCLQFNLRPMAPETVEEHLARVLQTEAVVADPPSLKLISRAARGSMRDALSLTDQAIAFGNGALEEDTVRRMLGSVDRSHVFHLIGALAGGDGKTVVETADVLRINGFSAGSTLEEMTAVLQRMAVMQAVPQMAAAVDAADSEAVEIARLAGDMPADETQLLYSLCLHGRAELGLAPDEYAALTMVLLRLLAFKPGSAQKKTLKPADTARAATADAAVPGPVVSNARPPTAEPAKAQVVPSPTVSEVSPPKPPVAQEGSAVPALPPQHDPQPQPQPQPSAVQASAASEAPARPVAHFQDGVPAPEAEEADTAGDAEANTAPPGMDDGGDAEWLDSIAAESAAPASRESGSATSPAVSAPEPFASQGGRAGLALPVHERPPSVSFEEKTPVAGVQSRPDATNIIAIPVRQQPEPGLRSQPRPDAAGHGPRPPAATFTRTQEGDVWHATVGQLIAAEAISALVRELALQSQLVSRDGSHWILRVERESLNQPTSRERLRTALATAGHAETLTVEIGVVSDSPARRNAAAAAARQHRAEEIVQNDPFVQQMVRDFGAKIVPGSIKPLPPPAT